MHSCVITETARDPCAAVQSTYISTLSNFLISIADREDQSIFLKETRRCIEKQPCLTHRAKAVLPVCSLCNIHFYNPLTDIPLRSRCDAQLRQIHPAEAQRFQVQRWSRVPNPRMPCCAGFSDSLNRTGKGDTSKSTVQQLAEKDRTAAQGKGS